MGECAEGKHVFGGPITLPADNGKTCDCGTCAVWFEDGRLRTTVQVGAEVIEGTHPVEEFKTNPIGLRSDTALTNISLAYQPLLGSFIADRIFGPDNRTPEEKATAREAYEARREAEKLAILERYTRLVGAYAKNASVISVLNLHRPVFDYTDQCRGCDYSGYEGEPPEWPCLTILLLEERMQ